jgi:hypothetical protein
VRFDPGLSTPDSAGDTFENVIVLCGRECAHPSRSDFR